MTSPDFVSIPDETHELWFNGFGQSTCFCGCDLPRWACVHLSELQRLADEALSF